MLILENKHINQRYRSRIYPDLEKKVMQWVSLHEGDLSIVKKALEDYRREVSAHIACVQKYCSIVGIPTRGLNHDQSKFSEYEYKPYAFYFKLDREIFKPEMDLAYEHHKKVNDHHWQHWTHEGEIPQEMSPDAAGEMICDWLAAGEVYDSDPNPAANTVKWYQSHKDHLDLHPNTRKFVENAIENLDRIGLRTLPNLLRMH